MKKFLVVLLIVVLVLGGGCFYLYNSLYNSKSVDLGVEITEEDIASLDEKLQNVVTDDETGVQYFSATLNEAETSVLFSRDLSNIMPCENVQVKLNEDQMVMSFMATLSEELVASINSPIALPEQASVYLECSVVTEDAIIVQVTSAKIADLPLPTSFLEDYQTTISGVFTSLGYESIKVNAGSMDVTGILK